MPDRPIPVKPDQRDLKPVEKRGTVVPGPRRRILLDIADASLPTLLEGIDAARCYLTDEGNGVYAFHAVQKIGESRKQAGEPAADVLVELMNEFRDALAADDVPQHLRDLWVDLVKRYEARTGRLPAASEQKLAHDAGTTDERNPS